MERPLPAKRLNELGQDWAGAKESPVESYACRCIPGPFNSEDGPWQALELISEKWDGPNTFRVLWGFSIVKKGGENWHRHILLERRLHLPISGRCVYLLVVFSRALEELMVSALRSLGSCL